MFDLSYQVKSANTLTWKALATALQSTISWNFTRTVLQGRSSGGRCMVGRSEPLGDGDGTRLTHHRATTRTSRFGIAILVVDFWVRQWWKVGLQIELELLPAMTGFASTTEFQRQFRRVFGTAAFRQLGIRTATIAIAWILSNRCSLCELCTCF